MVALQATACGQILRPEKTRLRMTVSEGLRMTDALLSPCGRELEGGEEFLDSQDKSESKVRVKLNSLSHSRRCAILPVMIPGKLSS
jgi:hypothetical protein